MERFTITRPLPCRTGGDELRGLSAHGRCPECGAEVMTTLVMATDPGLEEFVRLRHPRRVAASLLVAVAALAAAVLVQMVGPALAVMEEVNRREGPLPARVTALGWFAAVALLSVAAVAAAMVAPPSEPLLRAEWGRRRIATIVGFLLWGGAIASLPWGFGWRGVPAAPGPFVQILTLAWQLLVALLPLGGLRVLLMILGRRSLQWRHARQGRQGVDSLLAAAAGVLVFSTATPIMASYGFKTFHTLAQTLAGASAAILALGLVYLVANAWWIASSLAWPLPPVESLVPGLRPPQRETGDA